jgi:hypothetical protein
MIGFLLRPLLSLLMRQFVILLLQALGRDLRQRLPEVFAAIDAQVINAIQQGAGQVSLLFSLAVQRVVHRDPSALELRILTLLFDPAASARHAKTTSAATP